MTLRELLPGGLRWRQPHTHALSGGRAPANVACTVKSVLLAGVLGIATFALFQACGSKDDKLRVEPTEGGAGGERAIGMEGGVGGDRATGTESGAPSAGSPMSVGEGGVTAAGGDGSAPAGAGTEGGAAGRPTDAGGSGQGGEGGALAEVSCERATTCSNDLSGLGSEDFSIAFSIQTTATVGSGILSQRQICMRSKFWDIRLRGGGTSISVELDDEVNYTALSAPMVVNDGAAHEVRVCRKSGHVYVFADGGLITDSANATLFTTLAPLATKTTLCNGWDGTVALDGTVSDVCIGAL